MKLKLKRLMRSGKLIVFAMLAFILCSIQMYADESGNSQYKWNNFSMGYVLAQNNADFSFGVNITSPYFLWNRVAFRIQGELVYSGFISSAYDQWQPYYAFKAGLIGVGYQSSTNRFYGEGGLLVLLPNLTVSQAEYAVGGYGLFGFEFFLSGPVSYYIELGGNGIRITADNLTGSPDYGKIYFNGFFINVGFRWYF